MSTNFHHDMYGNVSASFTDSRATLDARLKREAERHYMGRRPPSVFEPWVTDKDLPPGKEFFLQYVGPHPWVPYYDENSPIDTMIETKTITREEMKRTLEADQFKSRLTPPPQKVLDQELEEFVWDLNEGHDSKVLLTEIPLCLQEIKNPKGDSELIAHVLTGYRIWTLARSKPNHPELQCVYSKLTRKWHQVGWGSTAARMNLAFTSAGNLTLAQYPWDRTPQAVGDNAIRTAMMVDAAAAVGVPYYALRMVALTRDPYHLRCLGNITERGADDMPGYLILLRALRAKPGAFEAMLALVDLYGRPDGILGDMFAHADKFRTL